MSAPSATRVALALLGAAGDEPLTPAQLVGAAEVLGLSPNAMRVALSRLQAGDEVVSPRRGAWQLSAARREPFAHVQRYRSGFAERVRWRGGFVGVLTADLPRRNVALVRRREHALELAGLRPLRHGLFVRPDNLKGGRAAVHAHLLRLGLDADAEVLGVSLDAQQQAAVLRAWAVGADATRARALTREVERLLAALDAQPLRKAAAATFWLGDEVLRFLARDPLLPEALADPAPRRALADAMAALDRAGRAAWREVLGSFAVPVRKSA